MSMCGQEWELLSPGVSPTVILGIAEKPLKKPSHKITKSFTTVAQSFRNTTFVLALFFFL